MIAAVKALPQNILDEFEYREWNLRTVEGVARFMALKATSLPAVAIDGHIVYQCEIPPEEDLIAAIQGARHTGGRV